MEQQQQLQQVPVEGRPERPSSTDIHPFLKRLNHSQLCVWPTVSSPNASLSILLNFRSLLAEFEIEFDVNPLLLHFSHFNRSVRSPNSTNTTSQKCTHKTHTSTQQNSAWQSGSQRVQLAIPCGTQLYYKRFSCGIPISGTPAQHSYYTGSRRK